MTDPITRSVLLPLALACAGLLLRPGATPPVPGKGLPEAHAAAPAPMAAPLAAPRACPTVTVHFSPNGGCEEEWITIVGSARKTVRVQAYSFTSVPIADALIAAHARGVDVAACLDDSNRTDPHGQAPRLIAAGVPVFYDARHKISHSKTGTIDGAVVLTGSFNLSASAAHANLENLVTIRDRGLAAEYSTNWAAHQSHSQPAGEQAAR